MIVEGEAEDVAGVAVEVDGVIVAEAVEGGLVNSSSFAALACFFFLSVAKTPKISSPSSSSSLPGFEAIKSEHESESVISTM